MSIAILIVALIVILIGAEIFTNALEHLGERLKISEGVTGSLFAAVGTAMPEAMVPIIAIFGASAGHEQIGEEVGIGAILGAPLMLSTIAFFVMACFAAHKRGWGGYFKPEKKGLKRDLNWFLVCFTLATIAVFIPPQYAATRTLIAISLPVIYFIYTLLIMRASSSLVAEGHGTEADHPVFLSRLFGRSTLFQRIPELAVIVTQLVFGFLLIIAGAKSFVHSVEALSELIGISPLVLSLLIIPIATELPEKVNSVIWIRRQRDTLAFGNITGAMVFQGSLLPAIGILMTSWSPRPEILAGMGLTLVATIYLWIIVRYSFLKPIHLIFNGLCYLAYILLVMSF